MNSLNFIIYIVMLFVFLLGVGKLIKPGRLAATVQKLSILGFSYAYVFLLDKRFLACIGAVTLVTYWTGLGLARKQDRKILIGSICALVGFLGYFKYANFFINNFRSLFGFDSITLSIILPLGVSFYVFSALSYIIDVYRQDYPAERNILDFSLYIAFFPKLTAGPIVRGGDFFPQAKQYRGITLPASLAGIQIFLFGLFKKLVLADHLGIFVDECFNAPMAFDNFTVILGAISYSLQIYFDFSGYSDMAIGVSKIMGFDFKPNFNLPYLSENVAEFWKRWHISLSSWFRDYLYIPLGGNRKGTARTYLHIMIVMLVSGLWHGQDWTFICWGMLHGLAICIDKAFGKVRYAWGRWVNALLTFFVLTLCWVVFRADNFSTALQVLGAMFTPHTGIHHLYTWSLFALVCLLLGTFLAVLRSKRIAAKDKKGNLLINGYYPLLDLSKFWSLVILFLFCGLIILLGYFGNTAFIYGTF